MVFLKIQSCTEIAPQCNDTYNYRLNPINSFNISLLTFAKLVQFLKRATVNAKVKVRTFFQPEEKLYLKFNKSQSIYAYKCYAYIKIRVQL